MSEVKAIERTSHNCGTSDGCVVFSDGHAYCFACGTYIPDYYNGETLNKAIRNAKKHEKEDVEDVESYMKVSDLLPKDKTWRCIRGEVFDKFGCHMSVSEKTGVPDAIYFPYYKGEKLSGWKVRLLEEKKMWSIGKTTPNLFGVPVAKQSPGKTVFITEGEYDAIALYQILLDSQKGTQWENYYPAVVSVPNGAKSAQAAILANLEWLSEKEIVLVMDMDSAGQSAITEIMKILPQARVAKLPYKDPNECLKQGASLACKNAVLFAKAPKNSRSLGISDLAMSAKQAPEFGIPYPWEWLTEKTRGIRTGETIYLGAGQKQGKSEIVNTIAVHLVKNGWKVFMCKPEEAPVKTVKMLAGKVKGKFFHDPTKPFDEDAFDEAVEFLSDNVFIMDVYQNVNWDSLKSDIRYHAKSLGCKAVFIDPITNLVNGLSVSDQNTKLQEIAQELSAMAKDLDIVIFIFCHLRNPDTGLPHERGGKVLSSQFAGSRAMARSCNYMFGLEGNRDPTIPEEERNMRTLVLLEDREYGETGELKLYWDKATGLFNEIRIK